MPQMASEEQVGLKWLYDLNQDCYESCSLNVREEFKVSNCVQPTHGASIIYS